MFLILRPIRLLLSAMISETTPRQKSLGLAFGILIGLVPKGNLLAISLGLLLAATRLNLGIAALGALLAALAAVGCDGFFDRVGWFVLSQPSLAGVWTRLYDIPWVPWTNFNNSIVMGSFVTGVALILPVHFATRPLFQRYSGALSLYAKRSWMLRLMTGAEVANRLSSVE
jgi:uncharacterized protein (TIGR03546 family)